MGLIFWTFFLVVVLSLFFVYAPRIRTTLENTGIMDRLSHETETETEIETESPAVTPDPPPAIPSAQPDTTADEPASSEEVSPAPAVTETKPAAPPAASPATGKSQDRVIYFIQVDGDGDILRMPVTRAIAVSGSPLADALRVLLQGPTAEERRRGLITLIPPGVQFLRAEVRGSTAYISFSEEFQFNNYGVEGYEGQLRQIIWTTTEFPNIADVQILIDGRIVEYLGERIKIGSPLGRKSL